MSLMIESPRAPKRERQHLEFERTLPGLNEYVNACRANRNEGAEMAKYWTNLVRDIAIYTHQPKWDVPVKVLFEWFEEDGGRDIDNVAFAKKFILDGLVKAGVLKDDRRRCVRRFRDEFPIDKHHPRVEVHITPADTEGWYEKEDR